jgi:hypothetical protein
VLASLGLSPLLECPAHQGLLSVDVLLLLKSGERVGGAPASMFSQAAGLSLRCSL